MLATTFSKSDSALNYRIIRVGATYRVQKRVLFFFWKEIRETIRADSGDFTIRTRQLSFDTLFHARDFVDHLKRLSGAGRPKRKVMEYL